MSSEGDPTGSGDEGSDEGGFTKPGGAGDPTPDPDPDPTGKGGGDPDASEHDQPSDTERVW